MIEYGLKMMTIRHYEHIEKIYFWQSKIIIT